MEAAHLCAMLPASWYLRPVFYCIPPKCSSVAEKRVLGMDIPTKQPVQTAAFADAIGTDSLFLFHQAPDQRLIYPVV